MVDADGPLGGEAASGLEGGGLLGGKTAKSALVLLAFLLLLFGAFVVASYV